MNESHESPRSPPVLPDEGSDEPPGRRPPPDGRTWAARRHVLSALGVLIVVALVAGFLIHLPYVIISPGIRDAARRVRDHHRRRADLRAPGNLLFLTVRVTSTTRTCGGS